MANSSTNSYGGIRTDPGTEINPLQSGVAVPAKSFIVGKYDEEGRRKTGGELLGGPVEANKMNKLMVNSMRTRGGELMRGFQMTEQGPVKSSQFTPNPISEANKKLSTINNVKIKSVKTKGKKKNTEKENSNYVEQVEKAINVYTQGHDELLEPTVSETFPVVFEIDSGTIKSSADAILEDEVGLILVYSSNDAISYIPKQGGKLRLALPGRRTTNVMYLGMQMQWYNTDQQLLIFVKINNE